MHVRILRHPSKDNKSSGYWKSRLLAKRHFTSMRDSTRFLCVCAVAAAFGAIALSSSAQNVRYWVWQRDEPLDDRELAELAAQNVDTIYRHVGELENIGTTWRWKARFSFPSSDAGRIRFVPVVRLVSHERQPFSEESVTALVARLSSVAAKQLELQLDYDAPDRLLGDYAAALKRIHGLVPRLSIAALPHWSRADYLKILEPKVDELFPMLYDFEGEPALRNQSPLPLISPEKISKLIDDWRDCRKPWRAGLPVFARLTIYDENRKFRGQIRNWNWDEICFNRNFQFVNGGQFGTTILRAVTATSIANTAIHAGEELIVREVDRGALRDAISAALRAGAQGIVFFRLPDSTASSGWSLRQLGHLQAGPQLLLRRPPDSEALELSNTGDGDLAPRFQGSDKDEGGYVLEVDVESPIFREAERGDFASVGAFAGDKPARVPFATRLRFRFAQLRAKENLRTGLIQLAPGADFQQTRYRILNVDAGSTWRPLE
jgi:hypothetical protein